MRHISTRTTQFAYFDQALDHPCWQGRKILDFGGNVAGFLARSEDRVDHDDYWCMDVGQTALAQGRQAFPRAHFVYFDRYSSEFNPEGTPYLPIPDCGLGFDFILAFSVFTHTHQSEMLELVGQLREMLTEDGIIAFTFCDPRYDRSLSNPSLPAGSDLRKNLAPQKALNPSLDIERMIETAQQARWCILIDETLVVEPEESWSHQERRGKPGESYCSYFRRDYMESLFQNAETIPPVPPEWQHCCLLRR